MKWYNLRKGNQEIKTDKLERSEEWQEKGFKLLSVTDLDSTSKKCKEGE